MLNIVSLSFSLKFDSALVRSGFTLSRHPSIDWDAARLTSLVIVASRTIPCGASRKGINLLHYHSSAYCRVMSHYCITSKLFHPRKMSVLEPKCSPEMNTANKKCSLCCVFSKLVGPYFNPFFVWFMRHRTDRFWKQNNYTQLQMTFSITNVRSTCLVLIFNLWAEVLLYQASIHPNVIVSVWLSIRIQDILPPCKKWTMSIPVIRKSW